MPGREILKKKKKRSGERITSGFGFVTPDSPFWHCLWKGIFCSCITLDMPANYTDDRFCFRSLVRYVYSVEYFWFRAHAKLPLDCILPGGGGGEMVVQHRAVGD